MVEIVFLDVICEFGTPRNEAIFDIKPSEDAQVSGLEHPYAVFEVRDGMKLGRVIKRFT
jgi:hypothetical protein